MNRVCITGTGRAGTTFLVRLLTLLGLNTGYKQEWIKDNNVFISKNCNAGLENYNRSNPPKIIKDPTMIEYPEYFILQYSLTDVIWPIRDFSDAADSRVAHGKDNGGLWNASNKDEQMNVFYKYTSEALYQIAKHNVNLHLLSFETMISDHKYLYDKIKFLFDEDICYDFFVDQYHLATRISTKK